MSNQEEIIEVCGKKVVVRYTRDCAPCEKCVFDNTGCNADCSQLDRVGMEINERAYFVEAEQPEEETHSLREWAQILATNPDLRAEFDKMCPPQPIQGSIAPEADKMRQPVLDDLDAEIEMEWDSFNKHFAEYDDCADEVVWLNLNTFTDIARHFAEWERKRTLDKVVEWMKANLTYTHPRKGVETCMINVPAFLDAMNEENT